MSLKRSIDSRIVHNPNCNMPINRNDYTCFLVCFPVLLFHISTYMRNKFRSNLPLLHDDVMKWKHFPRYWPFVRGIHRSPVNSLHKGQWRGALMFSLACVWINGWVNNREAGGLRDHRTHYVVTVMWTMLTPSCLVDVIAVPPHLHRTHTTDEY